MQLMKYWLRSWTVYYSPALLGLVRTRQDRLTTLARSAGPWCTLPCPVLLGTDTASMQGGSLLPAACRTAAQQPAYLQKKCTCIPDTNQERIDQLTLSMLPVHAPPLCLLQLLLTGCHFHTNCFHCSQEVLLSTHPLKPHHLHQPLNNVPWDSRNTVRK